MLVCNVSLRPPRRAITAAIAEAVAATDATETGNIVFATLVDDPASVGEIVDAYLGEIMLEAAAAADVADAGLAYATAVVEAVTAAETSDATTSHVVAPPLDGYSPTGAWSFSRTMLTIYGGSYYAATGGAITTLYDQSGGARNFTDAGNSIRRPTATTAGPNSRAAGDFNGTTNWLDTSALSNFITASSGFLVISAIVTTIGTNNSASYQNDGLLADTDGYFGIHLKTAAGGTVLAFSWDGSDKAATTTFTTGAPVVFTWRHESGTLYVSMNGGSEISVAAGNTGSISAAMRLCAGGTEAADCTVFEVASWSTVPNGTARAAIVADFKAWIGA